MPAIPSNDKLDPETEEVFDDIDETMNRAVKAMAKYVPAKLNAAGVSKQQADKAIEVLQLLAPVHANVLKVAYTMDLSPALTVAVSNALWEALARALVKTVEKKHG